MADTHHPTPLKRTSLVAAAVAGCFAAGMAFANPTGPTVVNGSAQITPNGNVLQITNTPSTIINWRQFSIQAGETTQFVQQSAESAVLNRVTTQNVSRILGTLESNGRVFLINRSGIVFGQDAQVDVAGLVASSLNMSNQDFLNERMRFRGGNGSVMNRGTITADEGREVYLIGRNVINEGTIQSPEGEIVLAAGASVELVEPGTPNLRVVLSPTGAANVGQISDDARVVGIFAGLDRSATVQATGAAATEDGRVVLSAGNGTQGAGNGATTTAGTSTQATAGNGASTASTGGTQATTGTGTQSATANGTQTTGATGTQATTGTGTPSTATGTQTANGSGTQATTATNGGTGSTTNGTATTTAGGSTGTATMTSQ